MIYYIEDAVNKALRKIGYEKLVIDKIDDLSNNLSN